MELITPQNIVFNEENHKYYKISEGFEMKELSGVTGIIKKLIFPDLYKDVDEATLQRAASHGTLCHKLCESYDNGELTETETAGFRNADGEEIIDGLAELSAYIEIKKAYNISIDKSEYLISDGNDIASCIDKVWRFSDTEFGIIDLKFTYNYNEEYVRWQTSIYADLFEKQNPGSEVVALYCIHIHNYTKDGLVYELHKLERIDSEVISNLISCYINNTPFENPLGRIEEEFEEDMTDVFNTLQEAARWEKKKKTVMDKFKKLFAEHARTKKFSCEYFSVTQGLPSHSTVFNEEQFKQENPELYRTYCNKQKVIAGRTTVTFNKK